MNRSVDVSECISSSMTRGLTRRARLLFADLKLRTRNLLTRYRRPAWFRIGLKHRFVTPNFKLAQYFFTDECVKYLVDTLDRFQNPCCLCTPRLEKEWMDRGRIVRVLDIDKRFEFLPGWTHYDIRKPQALHETFDVIVADPNFSYGIDTILRAVDTLSMENPEQKLLILYYSESGEAFLRTFERYQLKPTNYHPEYCNVKEEARNKFVVYANFNWDYLSPAAYEPQFYKMPVAA